MFLRSFSLSVGFGLVLACASPGPSPGPLSGEHFEDWSVHVVTEGADGDDRVTRIWIVEHDEAGAIRTGDSAWARNILRGSPVAVRAGGVDIKVSAQEIEDIEIRSRIDVEFATKYGWQETVFIPADRAASDDHYFRVVALP